MHARTRHLTLLVAALSACIMPDAGSQHPVMENQGNTVAAEDVSGIVDARLEQDVATIISGNTVSIRRNIDKLHLLIGQYLSAGRKPEAIALLRTVLTVESSNLEARVTLAELLDSIGKPDEARRMAMDVLNVAETETHLARIDAIDPSLRDNLEANNAWNAFDASTNGPRIVLVPAGEHDGFILREFGSRLNKLLKIPVSLKEPGIDQGIPERDPGAKWLDTYYRRLVFRLTLAQQALLGLDFEPTPATKPTRAQMETLIDRYLELGGTTTSNTLGAFRSTLAGYDSRMQYDADRLIADTKRAFTPEPGEQILIIAAGDIFSGNANFVFCSPQPPFACMSNARYFGAYWNEPDYRPRLINRMLQAAVWGAFANAGLPMCTTPYCMRSYVHNLQEQDRSENRLCEPCRNLWKTYSGHEPTH